jgi:hypothetical protein
MNRKFLATLSLVLMTAVSAVVAHADQVTIGPSSKNDNIIVQDVAGTTRLSFTGGSLHGVALYPDSNPFVGTYDFAFGKGTLPTIAETSPSNYDVTMGTAVLTVKICITTCGVGEVDGVVTLEQVAAFDPTAPGLNGAILVTKSTGILTGDFPTGPGALIDFTANLSKINPVKGIDYVYTHPGTSVQGPLSSGEVIGAPTPEPGTLALLGSGMVGLAGFLRRKISL